MPLSVLSTGNKIYVVLQSNSDVKDHCNQARCILEQYYKLQDIIDAKHIIFIFDQLTDPVSNASFRHYAKSILQSLTKIAEGYYCTAHFKISTQFPITADYVDTPSALSHFVNGILSFQPNVEFYYSLYSLNTSFRKTWLPKTVSPGMVGEAFAGTYNKLRIQHGLIYGENSNEEDVYLIHQWLDLFDLSCKFNLVRKPSSGRVDVREPTICQLLDYFDAMTNSSLITRAKIVSPIVRSTDKSVCQLTYKPS